MGIGTITLKLGNLTKNDQLEQEGLETITTNNYQKQQNDSIKTFNLILYQRFNNQQEYESFLEKINYKEIIDFNMYDTLKNIFYSEKMSEDLLEDTFNFYSTIKKEKVDEFLGIKLNNNWDKLHFYMLYALTEAYKKNYLK